MTTHSTPTVPAMDGCTDDQIIHDALAADARREALWAEWALGGRQGVNPDTLSRTEAIAAYTELVTRQRAASENRRG